MNSLDIIWAKISLAGIAHLSAGCWSVHSCRRLRLHRRKGWYHMHIGRCEWWCESWCAESGRQIHQQIWWVLVRLKRLGWANWKLLSRLSCLMTSTGLEIVCVVRCMFTLTRQKKHNVSKFERLPQFSFFWCELRNAEVLTVQLGANCSQFRS